MATITLYAGKINQMPGLINEVKKSVVDYKSELSALRKKTLNINRSVCNLDEVISFIQASSQTQDRKIDSLEKFCSESEKFISEVIRIDEEVAELINKRKENFYKEYYYLKPESEKSGWEKIKDGLKSVAEWCKENWESIAKIVVAAVVIAGLGIAAALTGGYWESYWQEHSGSIGRRIDRGSGWRNSRGDKWRIVSGRICGRSIERSDFRSGNGSRMCRAWCFRSSSREKHPMYEHSGKAINVTSKVTAALSFGMDGFDMLAMGVSCLIHPTHWLNLTRSCIPMHFTMDSRLQ